MADKKISALTAASTPLAGTEVLPIVQSGATVKVTVQDLNPQNLKSNATSGVMQVTGPTAASTRVMTIPNANFTAARTDAAQTFNGSQTFETASDNQVNIDATGSGAYSTINFKQGGVNKTNLFQEHGTTRFYIINSSGGVYLASGGTSWTAVSDERKKDIIEPITNATNKVNQLRAVIGKYKTDAEETRRSFLIAQDVQAVFPEAVDATNLDVLGLSYSEIIPLLVAAIKEQSQEIEQLKLSIRGN
jgi:hypothetical protein